MTVLQKLRVWPALALGVVALGLAVLVLGTASPVASASPESGDLDAWVKEQLQRTGVPGAAYAVVGHDGIEHQGTFGVDGDGDPVTAETAFLWGSVAKPVTATLVTLMAEAGELDLDVPVTTYLPSFEMTGPQAARITVRDLLAQTSGIPKLMRLTDRYDDPERRPRDIVPELQDAEPVSDVGEEFGYSSVNYVLLAAVVEEVTGRDYADVLTERVLEPAGMDTAVTDEATFEERVADGHRYVLGSPRAFEERYEESSLAAGYLGGSLEDLAAFARVQLSGGGVLDDDLRAQLHEPQVTTGDDQTYGLGWRTWPVFGADADMTWHSGATPGYQASVVILPEQDRAVVLLQNAYGIFHEPELLDTSWGLATLLSGGTPVKHPAESTYTILLSALGGLALLLVLLCAWSVRRIVVPRPSRRPRATLTGWLLGAGLVAVVLAMVPRWFGVGARQMTLWAPDLAGLALLGFGACIVLAVLRLAATLRARPPS